MKPYNQISRNLPNYNSKELEPYLESSKKAELELIKQIKSEQIEPLSIAYLEKDLEEIINIAESITKSFKKVVFLGVGGSSLGGKTLTSIAQNPKIEIGFLESIDVDTIKKKLNQTDFENSFFVVISKSGETTETICQTLIFLDKSKDFKKFEPQKHFIFITQNQESTLSKIAKEIGAKIYNHPSDIGGRFSYLSIVGLLPAAISGLDISKIRKAAKKMIDDFTSNKIEDNQIAVNCAIRLKMFDSGFVNDVIMPYSDNLKDFTDWYRQLWAESLGKDGFGGIPVNSMGTIDQHSQLQLYLDGPKDKFFTFITKNHDSDLRIKDLDGYKTRFGDNKLSKIISIEQNSTIEILSRKNLPIMVFELQDLEESTLSSLMMQMFLEVILIAKIRGVNPFDQPAVEVRKILAQEYLNNHLTKDGIK